MKHNINKRKIGFFLMLLKYVISFLLLVVVSFSQGNIRYFAMGFAELLLICILTNGLLRLNKVVGYVFNVLFIFLLDVQMAVLFFANSYVQTIMLSNLASLEDLSGKAGPYIGASVLVVILMVLPVYFVDLRGSLERRVQKGAIKEALRRKKQIFYLCLLGAALVLEVDLLGLGGLVWSPFANYVDLAKQEYSIYQTKHRVARLTKEGNVEELKAYFYKEEVSQGREKEAALTEQPNIILIYTEGLSQNIIDDERNIMPNTAALQEKSLTFINYYNHSFATYRGLIGTLYSGYQQNNLDSNSLVSIQSVLQEAGYYTTWINTEPNNSEFSTYLEGFGFDAVISDYWEELEGAANTFSDRQAYDLLWETVEELGQSDTPFFTAIYTFGTHATLDSADVTFGDGSNTVLNRFYSADYWLGEFLEKFESSSLAENTIIIFTTDHATYTEADFTSAFPDWERIHWGLDAVPLSIYYVGITPETIDVDGRNSLDLVPTILDYLDISVPNYFLGTSLFVSNEENGGYDTLYNSETDVISTAGSKISPWTASMKVEFQEDLILYYALIETMKK